jgi:hypothetical protein
MLDELCAVENGILCTSTGEPNMEAICYSTSSTGTAGTNAAGTTKNTTTASLVPERIHRKSSLMQICYDTDRERICEKDATLKAKVCPTGNAISKNLCTAFPDQCTEKAPLKNCTENIYDCLIDNTKYPWGQFCENFPNLCYLNYVDGAEMIADFCSASNDTVALCQGTDPNLFTICKHWEMWPERIHRKTSFSQMCHEVDYPRVCSDTATKD